jgi:hypothetical protein
LLNISYAKHTQHHIQLGLHIQKIPLYVFYELILFNIY